MMTSMCIFLVTAVGGSKVWQVYVAEEFPLSGLLEISLYLSMFVSTPMSLYRLWIARKDGVGPMLNYVEMNRPFLPLVALFVPITCWAVLSPQQVIDEDPRCFFFLTGTLFSNVCCRLVVRQMTNTQAESFNWLLAPLYFVSSMVLITAPSIEWEVALLRTLTTCVTLAHIHYAVCVVWQLADHLNIRVFSIRKPVLDVSESSAILAADTSQDGSELLID
ncbi:unnamed protein product [Cyprideis torosa]|uniref:Uncharacterized protein n=1 Tax=Cyprideis torosa TaxID=163714 RepID=A0A7R8W198_9CRUS|nr:unnamed protein product [Cyprideis torosa]CAG0880667.1 unnamed protein product [Cyprideis torosa]